MLRFKSCPRCKGDVLVDRDHHGWYEQCLQCGYHRDLQGIVGAQQPAKIHKGIHKNVGITIMLESIQRHGLSRKLAHWRWNMGLIKKGAMVSAVLVIGVIFFRTLLVS